MQHYLNRVAWYVMQLIEYDEACNSPVRDDKKLAKMNKALSAAYNKLNDHEQGEVAYAWSHWIRGLHFPEDSELAWVR